jgi:hypothetical protein
MKTSLRAGISPTEKGLSPRFGPLTSDGMSKRRSRNLPAMMTQLTLASWETIFRRSLIMAQGTCSASEYQRMITEKAAAMQASTVALMTGRGNAAALAPYLVRSRANARRLRQK